jgi:hypothetical protein
VICALGTGRSTERRTESILSLVPDIWARHTIGLNTFFCQDYKVDYRRAQLAAQDNTFSSHVSLFPPWWRGMIGSARAADLITTKSFDIGNEDLCAYAWPCSAGGATDPHLWYPCPNVQVFPPYSRVAPTTSWTFQYTSPPVWPDSPGIMHTIFSRASLQATRACARTLRMSCSIKHDS